MVLFRWFAAVPVEDGVIKKVIVIGLDGLEPTIVTRLLAANQLPNLAKLKEQGGFARVATTRPAQTPVAWSTFATGTNPGGHGIFDFLRRNPKTYLPELALNRYEQKNAFLPPKAVNLRRGTPVWDLLAAAGISSTVLRCPCSYPPDRVRGQMLSGMGVPDLRGGLGTATFYTSNPAVTARESEQVVRLERCRRGRRQNVPDRSPESQGGGRRPARRSDAPDRSGRAEDHAPVRRHAPRARNSPGPVERVVAGQVQGRPAPVDPRNGAVSSTLVRAGARPVRLAGQF